MEDAVLRQHAQPNTVFHCLYGFYCLGLPRKELARIYAKSVKTIGNWIKVYESTGTYHRADSSTVRKFSSAHQQWLCDFFADHRLAYLDEAQDAFVRAYHLSISTASVWRLIHNAGLTRKVLERRAMHIKELDVFRFVDELAHINWCYSNLIFLDEVSFDNRGMIRKRGYSLKGQTIAIRGDFQRKPRISVLAFLGVAGIVGAYNTLGTFDRVEFFQCCQDFAYSARGNSLYSSLRTAHSLIQSSICLDTSRNSSSAITWSHPAETCFHLSWKHSIVLRDSLCQRYLIIAGGRSKGISTRPGQCRRNRDIHQEQRAAQGTFKKK
eukprot:jgi/Phyca11/120216/e_gw1.40.329.1